MCIIEAGLSAGLPWRVSTILCGNCMSLSHTLRLAYLQERWMRCFLDDRLEWLSQFLRGQELS